MNDQIAIGVDIGGSHITSAAVNLETLEILPGTTYSVKVDNKAQKEAVLKQWSEAINKTIAMASLGAFAPIGFAIPGPFNYKDGIALFEGGNDKYENLFNVSIPDELPKYLEAKNVSFRFLNDATSFAVGVSTQGQAKQHERIIAVTLGTGFGSAFIEHGVPLVHRSDVPKDGCLWDKPYKDGIADDYFSTRWCVQRYQELSSNQVPGVKEIAEANTLQSQQLFMEFGTHMAQFMLPYFQEYQPGLLVMGGNISKAAPLFVPSLKEVLSQADADIDIEISPLMEDAAIIGSAKLFLPPFWEKVQLDLPNL